MNIFIDTNVLLRFFLDDPSFMHLQCVELLNHIQKGQIIPYTSNIVLLELNYTLLSNYKQSKTIALKYLTTSLKLRNITYVDNCNISQAINLYQKYNIKFGDCLIATQVPSKAILCTYDTDFIKVPHLEVATPGQILTKVKK